MQPYSPERRTALVLCGTGAHGAYHAGVLRALQEAGVKIDVMAGQGIGAAAAALAAIDGAARLWDADGLWRRPEVARLYGWKSPLRAAAWLAPLFALAVPFAALAVSFGASRPLQLALIWIPVGILIALAIVLAAGAMAEERRAAGKRRDDGRWWWRLFGAPLDPSSAQTMFTQAIAALVAGRYSEALGDGLGQPGFRELMIVATDVDSRRDIVAALLREPHRLEFLAARGDGERRSDVLDLAGGGRDHAFEMVAAALTPAVACDPQMLTFAADGYWRGETHRLCDRPGAVTRLLEELAAVGVSQAIIVSAVPEPSQPHRLSPIRLDLRRRLGEVLAASEAAARRDALEMARLRFDSVYLICPTHNPVGAFDLGGAYDEASDRRQDVSELMERAYDDAYRRFIEPVVGASGEHLARIASAGTSDDYPPILGEED